MRTRRWTAQGASPSLRCRFVSRTAPTGARRCASISRTTVRACRPTLRNAYSIPSTRRRHEARGSVSPSSARSSTRTTDGSTCAPRREAAPPSASRCRSRPTRTAVRKKERGHMGRILIADDHDSLRRGLAQALAGGTHDVDEAPNGNAAIERLHDSAYDVVVSDLRMGGSTGLEVLKTAKTLQPNCAVILMTAFGTISTAVEAMRAGAFDYVQKPFEIEEMEVKIAKALEM